ncbi:MAG TPA: divalent metal cation transporter [Vicinamibacterales bacterium]|jgi:Mn2+/Fe2+ NRAMP family transporter
MKKFASIGLGILTSVGGYLEVGSMGTALQAGAAFRYSLLWTIALGTICVAFLCEMTGRLAAVSHHTVVSAMRERFGLSFQIWPLAAQIIVDLFVLASELGGASLALQLVTGLPLAICVLPVLLLVWCCLWFATFGAIEHSVAILGLVTLCFVVAAWRLAPDWVEVGAGLLPHVPAAARAHYAYLAVSILGATISPYLVTFYSSGAIEEKWDASQVMPNRLAAAAGMGFGSLISMAIVVAAALVLAPRGIVPESFPQGLPILGVPFGRWGLWLFAGSLFIGCIGAALELALDVSYIIAQTFGWNWGEDQKPAEAPRFALVYTGALIVAVVPSLFAIDPLKLTMFSMALTVVALPLVVGPLIVVMNDRAYLERQTNGPVSNAATILIVALAFVLAVVAIPVQVMGR